MSPGDALFFHCNLLHTRWLLLAPHTHSVSCCSVTRIGATREGGWWSPATTRWWRSSSAQLLQFPQARNSPEEPHHHPLYTPILQLDNNSVARDLARSSLYSGLFLGEGVPEDELEHRQAVHGPCHRQVCNSVSLSPCHTGDLSSFSPTQEQRTPQENSRDRRVVLMFIFKVNPIIPDPHFANLSPLQKIEGSSSFSWNVDASCGST